LDSPKFNLDSPRLKSLDSPKMKLDSPSIKYLFLESPKNKDDFFNQKLREDSPSIMNEEFESKDKSNKFNELVKAKFKSEIKSYNNYQNSNQNESNFDNFYNAKSNSCAINIDNNNIDDLNENFF